MGVSKITRQMNSTKITKNARRENIQMSSDGKFKGFEYKTDEMLVPAKIWIPEDVFFGIGDGTITQLENMAKLPVVFDHVALTPDAHEGFGVPIGGVLALYDSVSCNAVGVDIGCGMLAVKTNMFDKDFSKKRERIMDDIYANVPVGFNWQNQKQDVSVLDIEGVRDLYWARVPFKESHEPYINMVGNFMGTMGANNHFMEFQMDENSQIWIMIHSGSRNLGQQIANYYHELAVIKCNEMGIKLPDEGLAYLSTKSPLGKEYLHSMNFGLEFARLNREHMLERAIAAAKKVHKNFSLEDEVINKHHNYAEVENHKGIDVVVHRKGAIKVEKGDLGIIPGSMDTGSYIVRGLGNENSYNSASHGAGRRMSRSAAAKNFDWDRVRQNFINQDVMIYRGGLGNVLKNWPRNPHEKGIERTMKSIVAESEKGYKDIKAVLDWESDIVEPVVKLTPRATLKG